MPSEKEELPFTPDPQRTFSEQKIIQVSFWKAFTVLSGAVLVSIVGTAFTIGSILNTDHFTLVRAVDDITDLKTTKLDKDIYELQTQQIINKLQDIEDYIKDDKTSQRSSTPIARSSQPSPQPSPQVTTQTIVIESQPTPPTEEKKGSEKEPDKKQENPPINLPVVSPLIQTLFGGNS